MIKAIRTMRSAFNLLLSVFELFVGLLFSIKFFGSGMSLEGGVIEYVNWIFGEKNENAVWFLDVSALSGLVSFLVIVLGFMFFSAALFLLIPYVLKQSGRNGLGVGDFE